MFRMLLQKITMSELFVFLNRARVKPTISWVSLYPHNYKVWHLYLCFNGNLFNYDLAVPLTWTAEGVGNI